MIPHTGAKIPSVCTFISTCMRKSSAINAAVTIIGNVTRMSHANFVRNIKVLPNDDDVEAIMVAAAAANFLLNLL